METNLFWAIIGVGVLTLVGVFYRIKSGFGPFNLRAVGLVFVGTLAALLGLKDGSSLTAAMGVLGAIAGYLFSLRDRE